MAASQSLHPLSERALDGVHRQVVDGFEDGVYLVDRGRRIEYWNASAERISGYSADQIVGRRCYENILNHVDEAGRVLCLTGCPLAATIRDGEPRETLIYLRHRDGHRVPVRVRAAAIRDESGAIVGASEVFRDASPVRRAAEETDELRRLAYVDELTGLPNRRAWEKVFAGRVASLARHRWPFALLLIDVDDFKAVNDRHGHTVGDSALRLVARTIANACRSEDVVARWGGDEFVVLVEGAASATVAQAAARIAALVTRSRLTDHGREIDLSVTIGTTIAEADDSVESAFERADHSLYEAKARQGAASEELGA